MLGRWKKIRKANSKKAIFFFPPANTPKEILARAETIKKRPLPDQPFQQARLSRLSRYKRGNLTTFVVSGY